MAQLIISAAPAPIGRALWAIDGPSSFPAGGNILDSRMVNLRGEFAIMILLECSDDVARKFAAELPGIGQSMRLKLTVTPQDAAAPAAAAFRTA